MTGCCSPRWGAHGKRRLTGHGGHGGHHQGQVRASRGRCCCCTPGHYGPGFRGGWRRFTSSDERRERLEAYREELEEELKAVRESLEEL